MLPFFIDESPEDQPEIRYWQDLSECSHSDPELFFPKHGDKGNRAKRICAVCPVFNQCLEFVTEYELTTEVLYGVWAGKSQKQRILEKRKKLKNAKVAEAASQSNQ